MNSIKFGLISVCLAATAPILAQKTIPLVYDQEFIGSKFESPAFPTVDESPAITTLPNPFEFSNSTKQ